MSEATQGPSIRFGRSGGTRPRPERQGKGHLKRKGKTGGGPVRFWENQRDEQTGEEN